MKQTLFLLLFPLLTFAQETTTFTVDTLGRQNVQLTTITTYQRPDSTVYETRSSVRFKNRGEARKHINLLFAERITADSVAIENARRHRAGLVASREALLADLGRVKRNADVEPPSKWNLLEVEPVRLNTTVYPAEVPPAEPKLPTIKQAKPKAKAKTKSKQ